MYFSAEAPVFVAKGNAPLRRNFVDLHQAGFAGRRFGGLVAVQRQGCGKYQQTRTEDQESFAQEQHRPGSQYICRCIVSALPAGNQDFHIISQLPGGELIAFEIGCQPASAVDYQGMRRVRDVAFVGPEIQSDLARNGLHFVERPGQEVPRFRIGLPGRRIFCHYVGSGHAPGRS